MSGNHGIMANALGVLLAMAVALAAGTLGAQAADMTSELMASDRSGIPDGYGFEQWLAAQGRATATVEGDEHVVRLEASGLVPDGLYTIWWVNPGLVGTGMGPGGGVPHNEFRADREGKAEVTLRVPADSGYRMMVIAYHADDATHGEDPGKMGEITFEHLSGPWPGR